MGYHFKVGANKLPVVFEAVSFPRTIPNTYYVDGEQDFQFARIPGGEWRPIAFTKVIDAPSSVNRYSMARESISCRFAAAAIADFYSRVDDASVWGGLVLDKTRNVLIDPTTAAAAPDETATVSASLVGGIIRGSWTPLRGQFGAFVKSSTIGVTARAAMEAEIILCPVDAMYQLSIGVGEVPMPPYVPFVPPPIDLQAMWKRRTYDDVAREKCIAEAEATAKVEAEKKKMVEGAVAELVPSSRPKRGW